ncbi:MAG: CoA transferase [Chloroflexi bacterium]|nr:CoA transferase [Chloroflexota bacterium]
MAEHALSGLRVLDLTHYIAGPFCTKLLAGHGAEVIKIERPDGGDGARRLGPFPGDVPHPEKSALFLYLNTSKKGITLNLKTATGRTLFRELVRQADVVVENFAPRVLPSLGLDYPALAELNPHIVLVSISNFGQTGPYRDYQAADITEFALSGHMNSFGDPQREPLKYGGAPSQYMAGLNAYYATMAAVFHAARTGEGQQVDVSIQEALTTAHGQALIQYEYTGTVARRSRGGMEFPCQDGPIHIVDQQPQQWARFTELIGQPELAQDPRFRTASDRREHAQELVEAVSVWTRQHTKEEVYHLAQGVRIPTSYPTSTADLLASAQLQARGFFIEIDHPATGPVTYPGAAYEMRGLSWVWGPAPQLGQHNVEVYCGRLGYSKADLVRLRQSNVI